MKYFGPSCRNGHTYTAENTRYDCNGHRHCRACDRFYSQQWTEKRSLRRLVAKRLDSSEARP